MRALYFFGIGLLLLAGCKEVNPVTGIPEETAAKRELTPIQGYPEDFRGCGCSFSRTREEFRQQKFMYLEKYGSADPKGDFRMISMDGEPIRWASGESPKGFEVEVLYDSETATDQEVREIEGRLVVRFDDGKSITTPVYGICGC